MSFPVLSVIVLVEIGLFQFLSTGLTRSLFAVRLGEPPEAISGKVSAYMSRVFRFRFVAGAVLALPALLALCGWPPDSTVRKLMLAAVSVTSAVLFAVGFFLDGRTVRSLVGTLPESGVRRALLEPRTIRRWYAPTWEALPFATLVSTAVFVLWTASGAVRPPIMAWILLGIQAAFVVGALIYTLRFGVSVPNVSMRLASLRDRPETALLLGERLAAREMQYLMLAKIGVSLLLGVSVVHVSLRAGHHAWAPWFSAASWVLVGLLMLAFAAYLVRLMTLIRHTLDEREQPRNG